MCPGAAGLRRARRMRRKWWCPPVPCMSAPLLHLPGAACSALSRIPWIGGGCMVCWRRTSPLPFLVLEMDHGHGPRRAIPSGRLGTVQRLVLRACNRQPCRPGVAGVFLPAWRPRHALQPSSSWHVISPVTTGFLLVLIPTGDRLTSSSSPHMPNHMLACCAT